MKPDSARLANAAANSDSARNDLFGDCDSSGGGRCPRPTPGSAGRSGAKANFRLLRTGTNVLLPLSIANGLRGESGNPCELVKSRKAAQQRHLVAVHAAYCHPIRE
jgi:hypothetical protein